MRADKWAARGRAALPNGRPTVLHEINSIGRRCLPHEGSPNADANPEGEVYFVTICCVPRGVNQLANTSVWQAMDESLSVREARGDLHCRLVLAMPDHFHGLLAFTGSKSMSKVIADFKAWLAKRHGIHWQRDFFDHRLRGWESAVEKAKYIRMNPVRAGLVVRSEDWPYQR